MEYCIICYDPLQDTAHNIICAECNIDIHDECYENWLGKDEFGTLKNTTCPHCRENLFQPAVQAIQPEERAVEVELFPQALAIIVPPPPETTFHFEREHASTRVSPSQEEIRDTLQNATRLVQQGPAAQVRLENQDCGIYIVLVFITLVTSVQEYLVYHLNLNFEYFILYFLGNVFLILSCAKLVHFFPYTSLETWFRFPMFSSVLCFFALLVFKSNDLLVVDFLMAWFFNVILWNFIYLIILFYSFISSKC